TAAYLTYKNDLSERTELEAGLRAEDTRTRSNSLTTPHDVNRRYLDFFPAFHLGHQLNQQHKLNLSFSRRINRPLYEDLNPFLYFLDQYNFREGNPYLRPEYTSTAEIGHVYKEKFSTTASYTYVKDIFLAFQKQDDLTGITVLSKKNLNSQETVGLEFAADLSPAKWWNTSYTVQGNYMHFTYLSDGNTLDKHTPFYTANLINSLSFKKDLNAELILKYESATNYGLFDFKPYYGLDLSVSRTLLKKRASFRFSVTDILNTRCNRYSTLYQNLNLQAEEKAESRVARITFNYRFGKATVKGARKRSTGAEEESQRIKG
ncbi:MAG TPA: outer membrane beta-barrel family protein, partial [Sphingobacteriaceae bacterium]